MPRFAANLTMLFTELPLLSRFAAARDAGFTGVEMLFPYDLATRDLDRAARQNDLDFVLLNCPPPNWAGGPRGFAAQPG
ncbi:MAG: hydroxypyruvate isomerase, partial [Paracoccus sp. (in: a-proteobacteria)]|nr:hydroxypyruvate isomerase [Paracoccus sp. (in: a-proteobacteria)]